MQRIEELAGSAAGRPLYSLFNPADNKEGSTAVITGLGQIEGNDCRI